MSCFPFDFDLPLDIIAIVNNYTEHDLSIALMEEVSYETLTSQRVNLVKPSNRQEILEGAIFHGRTESVKNIVGDKASDLLMTHLIEDCYSQGKRDMAFALLSTIKRKRNGWKRI